MHWHKEAEWAYVLDGEVRVTALDYEGGNFIDDLKKGDLWVSIYIRREKLYTRVTDTEEKKKVFP